MKISIITTIRHNVGDDFVREGIIYILKQKYQDHDLSFKYIHKHSPITTRKGFEWFRYNKKRIANRIDNILPLALTEDRILTSDLLVQSGAPVFWCHPDTGGPHCSHNEWYKPLIERRFKRRKNKIPFLNIAAGSCQKYDSDGTEFDRCDSCKNYIHDICNITNKGTVRDELARKILLRYGYDYPAIPCSSIFAHDNLSISAQETEYVALSFMKLGSHFSFDQGIDSNKWENEFKKFYNKLKIYENCVFVCHNQTEVDLAKKIDSSAQIFQAKNYIEYIKFYSKAKMGFMNRIHGAFPIASFGRPALIIGTDSRTHMADMVNLDKIFVNDIDSGYLFSMYEQYCKNYDEKCSLIQEAKSKALNDYLAIL